MIIREAKQKDVKILNRFFQLLLEDEKNYNPNITSVLKVSSMYEYYIRIPNHKLFVAEENEELLGYIYGINEKGEKIFIDALFVSENHRSEKVGTNLLNAIINYAKEQDVKIIELNVHPNNEKAKKLYEKIGFHQTGKYSMIYEI